MNLKLFKKNSEVADSSRVITIPNLMSFFRLALVPVILYVYLGLKLYWLAAALVILSAVTDVFDGILARKLNQITEVGKLLDPVADKMTQGIMILCLLSRYALMIPIIILFIAREIVMIVFGMKFSKKNDAFMSSKWFGKVNTVIVEGTVLVLMIFTKINETLATILMIVSIVSIILSTILYVMQYRKELRNAKKAK